MSIFNFLRDNALSLGSKFGAAMEHHIYLDEFMAKSAGIQLGRLVDMKVLWQVPPSVQQFF